MVVHNALLLESRYLKITEINQIRRDKSFYCRLFQVFPISIYLNLMGDSLQYIVNLNNQTVSEKNVGHLKFLKDLLARFIDLVQISLLSRANSSKSTIIA